MSQPVRQAIAEAHPETLIKPFYTLLIDGSAMLRLSMVDTKTNEQGIHYGGIFQMLLQIKMLMQKADYSYVYVFFDNEDSGILRYNIYKDYKSNRDKKYQEHTALSEYAKKYNENLRNMQKYIFEKKKKNSPKKEVDTEKLDKQKIVDENFMRERDILCKYFNELYIRWVADEVTEGDDLIAYYVQNKKPEEKIVIATLDEDLTQLISDTVCIYNLREKKYISNKNFQSLRGFPYQNVVLKKILLGDASDNISNIKGLSESRLFELMPEIKERPVTLEEVKQRAKEYCDARIEEKKKPLQWQENIVNGVPNKEYDGDFYEINRKLIDLSHPILSKDAKEEMDGMMYNAQDPEGRSLENLYRYIMEDNITELKADNGFSRFFETFKPLMDKEQKRYKEMYS